MMRCALVFVFCVILYSCTSNIITNSKSEGSGFLDSGSANVATGFYIERRLKNFFGRAIGENPRDITSSESTYLFENAAEVITPQELAALGAVDMLESARCGAATKGALWGKGVCVSSGHILRLANQKIREPNQSYFSLIRQIAAPMCDKLVGIELEREPNQNYLIKQTVVGLQDSEAPTAEDLSEVMTKMYGYGPEPLDLHPGSDEIAGFILQEMQRRRDQGEEVTTESAKEFMSILYKGVCLVLTHSPQMILQ